METIRSRATAAVEEAVRIPSGVEWHIVCIAEEETVRNAVAADMDCNGSAACLRSVDMARKDCAGTEVGSSHKDSYGHCT